MRTFLIIANSWGLYTLISTTPIHMSIQPRSSPSTLPVHFHPSKRAHPAKNGTISIQAPTLPRNPTTLPTHQRHLPRKATRRRRAHLQHPGNTFPSSRVLRVSNGSSRLAPQSKLNRLRAHQKREQRQRTTKHQRYVLTVRLQIRRYGDEIQKASHFATRAVYFM